MKRKVRNFFGAVLSWLEDCWGYVLMVGLLAVGAAVAISFIYISFNDLQDEYVQMAGDYSDLQDEYVQVYNQEYDFYKQLSLERDDGYIIEQKAGDGNYFYNTLSDDEKALYKMLYKVLKEFWDGEREPILESGEYYLASFRWEDYPGIEWDYLESMFAFVYDNPSLFLGGGRFVDLNVEYPTYIENKGELSKKNQFYYTVSIPQEYIELRKNKTSIEAAIEESVLELSHDINDNDNDLVKYAKIYEYVINNTKYLRDYESEAVVDLNTTTVIGVLDGKANTGSICQGYAAAMSYLCNIFDVDCLYVRSTKIKHAFNLVCIDGIWYYSDATNGDNRTTYIECFLGGESAYWSFWNYDESYLFDTLEHEVPTVSKTNYPINENTYTGNLVID